jgi:ribosomal protein S1
MAKQILKTPTSKKVQGKVKRRAKGGFVVDIDGIETFLTDTQIKETTGIVDDSILGKSYLFSIVLALNNTKKDPTTPNIAE